MYVMGNQVLSGRADGRILAHSWPSRIPKGEVIAPTLGRTRLGFEPATQTSMVD
jgi:hypothetical protein